MATDQPLSAPRLCVGHEGLHLVHGPVIDERAHGHSGLIRWPDPDLLRQHGQQIVAQAIQLSLGTE